MLHRWFLTVIITIVVLIPTWIFLLAKSLLNPEGFWQTLVMYGLGFYLLAGIQFILLIVGFFLVCMVWAATPQRP